MLAELCEGLGDLALASGLNGFYEDRVQIVVVENNVVLGAMSGGVQEMIGLVAGNSAGNGHCFGKHTMGSDVCIGRYGQRCHAVWWRNGG